VVEDRAVQEMSVQTDPVVFADTSRVSLPSRKRDAETMCSLPTVELIEQRKKFRGATHCSICDSDILGSFKNHTLTQHLPWYWNPALLCWPCGHRFVSQEKMERHISKFHQGLMPQVPWDEWARYMEKTMFVLAEAKGVKRLSELAKIAANMDKELLEAGLPPDSQAELNAQKLAQEWNMEWRPPLCWNPPRTIFDLTWWYVFSGMLGDLNPEQLKEVCSDQRAAARKKRSQPTKGSQVQSPAPAPAPPVQEAAVAAVEEEDWDGRNQVQRPNALTAAPRPGLLNIVQLADAHCHYDRLARGSGLKITDERIQPVPCDPPVTWAIPSFAFPVNWNMLSDEVFQSKKTSPIFALGWHPSAVRHYDKPATYSQFNVWAKDPRCKAIGEVGLEYKPGMIDDLREKQKILLHDMTVQALAKQLPLVLHIRQDEPDPYKRDAYADALEIVRSVLKPSHAVYLHSFMGDAQDEEAWRAVFSNLYVGVCPRLLREQRRGNVGALATVDAIRRVTLDRLLLESDSPFQLISGNKPTTPAIVLQVAIWLAELKEMPLRTVASVTWDNTRRFYNY
jgi:TatD DNase family protein